MAFIIIIMLNFVTLGLYLYMYRFQQFKCLKSKASFKFVKRNKNCDF